MRAGFCACAQMNEGAMLGSKHSLSVGRCLKWRILRCYDADALLKVGAASGAASPVLLQGEDCNLIPAGELDLVYQGCR